MDGRRPTGAWRFEKTEPSVRQAVLTVVGDRIARRGGHVDLLMTLPAVAAAIAVAMAPAVPVVAVLMVVAATAGIPPFSAASYAGQLASRPQPRVGRVEMAPAEAPAEPRGRVVPRAARKLSESPNTPAHGSVNGLYDVADHERPPWRLSRDLHDGLGPVLASAAMRADVARTMVISDPAATELLLVQLREDLRNAVADVRRLAYQASLQTIEEVDLPAALRMQARRFEQAAGGRLRITVACPSRMAQLQRGVEVAMYRIASEALTNVVRHSAARNCLVRLIVDKDACLEVIDDGVGLPDHLREGIGLSSMRERARAFGGECVIEAVAPHGTRVRATVPLRRWT
jgi:signal transduction histidine kinase